MILQELFEAGPGGSDNYAENLAQKVFNVRPNLRSEDDVLNIGYKVAVQDLASQTRAVSLFSRDQDFPSDFVSAYYYLQKQRPSMAEEVDTGEYDARRPTHKGETTPEQEKKFRDKVRQYGDELEQRQKEKEQGVAEGLNEFAPGSDGGNSGHWYTDDELADIIGDDWFDDFDVSNDGFNIDAYGEKAKQNLVGYANTWFDDRGYNVNVMGVEHNDIDHDLQWYIVGSFQNDNFAKKDVPEDSYKNSQAYRADGGANDENHELDQRRDQQEKSGTWYIRLNGKLIKDKQGNPYSFRGKAAANKAALTMQAKLFNQGKEFMLTTNPNDNPQGVAEASQRVDSLVTDALKIMQGATMNDAVAALKTVLGNREYNDRRGHYNFYVRQLMDMYGQQGVAEGLASKTKQISENQYIPKHKRW
jgi:hypothetical protein